MLSIDKFVNSASEVVIGAEQTIKLALCCFLSRGHLLIEDIPGLGKTTLVKTFSRLLGLEKSRIQFTNDLLPADILGVSIFDKNKNKFIFHEGPIFSEIVIADELNRATPKTQSACLQAMEEGEISIDKTTYKLPKPFIVVATQNNREHSGTFPLPESQLDRFLMKINMGFPKPEFEKKILSGEKAENKISSLQTVIDKELLLSMQDEVDSVFVSDELISSLQNIIAESRILTLGLSTRASLAFLQAAKSWAYMHGRDFVIPEDLKAVAFPLMNHRIFASHELDKKDKEDIVEQILSKAS